MKPRLKKLISIASPALCKTFPLVSQKLLKSVGASGEQLMEVLNQKNGFYAFEGALHLLPAGCNDSYLDLESWNRIDSWRKEYRDIVSGYIFFAEDVFGVQFALHSDGVYKFDPEIGEVERHADDLERWAAHILDNYEYETGCSLAREWQAQHGLIPAGKRLLPKTPFVLGGAYEVENLYAADALKGMEFRADIWRQIRDLPNGAEVKLRIIE